MLVLLLLAGVAQSRFDAAVTLEATDVAAAATAFEELARDAPDDALAADALAEAAGLAESRLYDPARALADWTRVVDDHPQSRVARRAALQKAELEHALVGASSTELGTFEELLVERGPALAAFVAAHPAFAERGGFAIAQDEERTDPSSALRRYDEVAARNGAWAARATRAAAELCLRLGRLTDAQHRLDALERFDDPISRAAVVQGRAELTKARVLRALSIAAWIVLALFAIVATRPRALWPPPVEVRYLAPVALLFALATIGSPGTITRAVTTIALGAIGIAWVTGSRRSGPRALLGVVAMAALVYLAIRSNDLVTTVIETLKNGPD